MPSRNVWRLRWFGMSAFQARLMYAVTNILLVTMLLLSLLLDTAHIPWNPIWGPVLGVYGFFLLSSWCLFVATCYREPGYIGYPEPDSSNRALLWKLYQSTRRSADKETQDAIALKPVGISASPTDPPVLTKKDVPIHNNVPPLHVSTDHETAHLPEADRIQNVKESELEPSAKTLITFGQLPRRNCDICKVPQPLRARHCFTCGQCVLRFDHHCPFTGMCVGQNNHLLFYVWLTVQIFVTLFTLVLFLYGVAASSATTSSWRVAVAGVGAAFTLVWAVVIGSTWGFQTSFLLRNLVTYEAIRDPHFPQTWPWYFRVLLEDLPLLSSEVALSEPNREDGLLSQATVPPPVLWNPFHHPQGVLGNIRNFLAVTSRGMKFANRGWRQRYRLGGALVPFPVSSETMGSSFRQEQRDWVTEMYIPEVDEIPIHLEWVAVLRQQTQQV